LPDGDWARFYELRTNRPLYIDNQGKITYDAHNLLDHYSMKSAAGIPDALALVDTAQSGQPVPFPFWPSVADRLGTDELEAHVRRLVETIDDKGRWIEDGWIRSATFVDAAFLISRNLQTKP
jgi:hypothetical protein